MFPNNLLTFKTDQRKQFPVLTGLQMHYDADAPLTIIKDSQNRVSQWRDRSGFNRHAVQATDINKPTWQLRKIGGKPAVVFDGINDFMTMGDGTLSFLNTSSITMFVAFNRPDTPVNKPVFGGTGAVTRGNFVVQYNSATSFKVGFQNDDANALVPNVATGTSEVYTFTFDALTSGKIIRRNGVEELEAAGTGSLNNMVGQALGRYLTTYGNFELGEVALFNRVLSTQEILDVETALMIKWGAS